MLAKENLYRIVSGGSVPCPGGTREIDVIWNITLVCPWNCPICCVDATHVTRSGDQIQIKSKGLAESEGIQYRHGAGSVYDQALAWRQQKGLELDLAGKMRVLDNLEGFRPKIDFSGGDPLSAAENLSVIRAASRKFGRDRITLTATGAGLARSSPDTLAPLIGELNFTFDTLEEHANGIRPAGYARGNLAKAREFVQAGVVARAECPLNTRNINEEMLRAIYMQLNFYGIQYFLPMRLFPVGRGMLHEADVPTPAQYRRAIALLRELERKYQTPKVKLQCALRHLDPAYQGENPCDMVRESFGLTANGTLLASPWAVGPQGAPLDEAWVLGNLSTTSMRDILMSPKAQLMARRCDENHGHCKIFAYLNGQSANPIDRMFEKADPLYQATERHSDRCSTQLGG